MWVQSPGGGDGSRPGKDGCVRQKWEEVNAGRTSDVVFGFTPDGLPLSGMFLPFMPS